MKGDFQEIVDLVEVKDNMIELDTEELMSFELSVEGEWAREILLDDIELLRAHGAAPVLNVIDHYDRDDSLPFFTTDVYSFHVDRSPQATDTFLCTYFGESTELLPNSEGVQKVLIPELRNKLKKLYDGPDSGFESFLRENFFDLHYAPRKNANIVSLGRGSIWKIAVDHPESKVLPCLHRAPKENNGEKRLLLIC